MALRTHLANWEYSRVLGKQQLLQDKLNLSLHQPQCKTNNSNLCKSRGHPFNFHAQISHRICLFIESYPYLALVIKQELNLASVLLPDNFQD